MNKETYWPHCNTCNFPLQDQGTPNGLVCLLCEANSRIEDMQIEINELKERLSKLEWP